MSANSILEVRLYSYHCVYMRKNGSKHRGLETKSGLQVFSEKISFGRWVEF